MEWFASLSWFWAIAAGAMGGLLCLLGMHGLRATVAEREELFGPRWAERLAFLFLNGFILLSTGLVLAAVKAFASSGNPG